MQFIHNGPDIPERLLQAHEEGRVVFFCGAGISYPAGLPGFRDLVTRLYKGLSVAQNAIQGAAIKAGQFDTAIGLLEADIGREAVRRSLAEILTPDLTAPNATATHQALLTLAKSRDGHLRLITTNFDRLFEEVIEREKRDAKRFPAPLLPIPKNNWDGLVYLHGLLTHNPTSAELDRLIVSSGDFGLAYLIERWAARFVSELLRGYTVCFVGYSIADPVLRYMMDALATNRLLGESYPPMYAFGSYSKGQADKRKEEWLAKNVIPILYREHRHHKYLHKTLRTWSETYRDGVRGKERVVDECASLKPVASTQQDNFTGRLLWALSDKEGLPAKRFAEFNPAPPLAWLDIFSAERFSHDDLFRFGVQPNLKGDDALKFSLTRRPAPYAYAPRMALMKDAFAWSEWDEPMKHLGSWLTRYLDAPKLIIWLTNQGGQPHYQFAWLLESKLKELDDLAQEKNTEALETIRAASPNAIPRPEMRTLWRLLLTGRLKANRHPLGNDLYDWLAYFNRDGLTPSLRLKLREMLAPRVALRKPFRMDDDFDEPDETPDWDIVLSTDHVYSTLGDRLAGRPRWKAILPELLDDFCTLLRDTLDLMRELGGADDLSERSYIDQPSISEHSQNNRFHDWTVLVELVRDAWLATAETDPARARLVAESWMRVPYPLFKRLAFFAAAQDGIIQPGLALEWLLTNDRQWLWLGASKREAIRLLVALAPKLEESGCSDLEQAILDGPPRSMFIDDIEADRLHYYEESMVWLRLAKMDTVGALRGGVAKKRLLALSEKHPNWKLADDQRDEFVSWLSLGGEWQEFVATPRRRRDLVAWLKQSDAKSDWHEDDWRERCRVDFPTTACALCALAREGIWTERGWREALQAWADDRLLKRSWRYMAPVLSHIPDEHLKALSHALSWWLLSLAKTVDLHMSEYYQLCRRVLAISYDDEADGDDPVSRAINHPVGQVVDALLKCWFKTKLEDGQDLPEPQKTIFTEICDVQVDKFRHGRVQLATHVITLFRVDKEWAVTNLVPLFDWGRSRLEARAAWEGFLRSPRLYPPLMELFKVPFLETVQHFDALGRHDDQYTGLLTYIALDGGDVFTSRELVEAFGALSLDGLQSVSSQLIRFHEGAGDQRQEYWNHRIKPFLKSIWPKSLAKRSPEISENLARLCIALGGEFPGAFEFLRSKLMPLKHPDYVVSKLHEAGHCCNYPEAALAFLVMVIGDDTSKGPPTNLIDCLNEIQAASPPLADDDRFQKLKDYLRRHGRG
jgi:hypothetical protein